MSELFIRSACNQSLDAFVAALPNLIGLDHWEQRQSSNYVEERYYRCVALGVRTTAAIADCVGFEDWQLWLSLQPQTFVEDGKCLDGLAECVARALVLQSYEVIRPNDGRVASSATLYQLNPDDSARASERIQTKRVAI